ncbi:LOW QUALITY PROTEIN: enhancer of mRNA-decapping protein 4-like [Ciona intestinalis]
MDASNGLPIQNGHHELSNSLKEMLKINSSNTSTVQDALDVSHDGSGDHRLHISSPSVSQAYAVESDTISSIAEDKPHETDLQNIFLNKASDGECVSLHGPHTRIHASSASELESQASASNKVKINTITKFDWEHRYYAGNLLTVTDMYIAYCIKGRNGYSVRVINRNNSSDRVLLKGFTGAVCDVGFAPHTGCNILAAVDSVGNLIVWSLEQEDGHLAERKRIHLTATPGMCEASQNHRVMWIPYIQRDEEEESSYGSKAETTESSPPKFWFLCIRKWLKYGIWTLLVWQMLCQKMEPRGWNLTYVSVTGESDADISDCELSPIGNVLAAASTDGFVKFWQVQIEEPQPPTCLHQWKPHDGKPVSCVKFCDNKKQPENSIFWRFLLTGCERNNELKIWCTVTWNCLQVVDFFPSTLHAVPELNLVLYLSADFLVLSDVHRKILYVMQCKTNIKDGTAQLSSIAHFQLTSPLLSIAFVDARPCKFKALVDSSHDDHNKDQELSGSEDEDQHEDEEDDDEDRRIRSKSGDSKSEGDVSNKLDGVLIKLITIQTRSLQSLDVRFISNDDSDIDEIPRSLSTYNTISEDLKDIVSLSSMEENFSHCGGEVGKSIDDGDFMAGGDAALAKFVESTQEKIMTETEHQMSPDVVEHHEIFQSEDNSLEDDEKVEIVVDDEEGAMKVSPDITHSNNQPVLLTPYAFISSFKSPGTVGDSANSSFTAVTPFSNHPVCDQQLNNFLIGGVRGSLSNLMISSSSVASDKPLDAENPSVPSSSPVLPRASSSPSAAPEVIFPPRSVKSPDLISSTSTQDGEGAKAPDPSSSVVLPASLSTVLSRSYSDSSAAVMVPSISEPFSQMLRPVTSTQWPKAPDVTMSRPVVVSSPPAASSSLDNWPPVEPIDRPIPHQIQPVEPDHPPTQSPQPSYNEDIIQLINNFKEEQKLMMINHQKELQSIVKKQNQLQKSSDASTKKTDNQVDKLDKAVRAVSENQKKLSTDLKLMQSGVTEATAGKIDRIIKSEVKRTIMPGMNQTLESVKGDLTNIVSQKLTATDAILRENIPKVLRSKDIVDHIGTSTAKAIHSQVQASLPEIFFTTLIPAFERSCQNMFQQLSTTYHRGMEETLLKLEKQMTVRVKPDNDRLQTLIKDAYTAGTELQNASKLATSEIANVMKDVPNQIEKAFTRCEERLKEKQEETFAEQRRVITDLMRDVITRTLDEKLSQGGAEASVLGAAAVVGTSPHLIVNRPSILDQQQQILKMLQQGNVNTAFQTALTASDLNLVMYVCETVDPSVVFGVSPCPLQQPILLSLIQQLSSDLGTKTDIKLKYLQEAVMNLDRRHQVTQEYMHSVLSALVQKLNKCLLEPLEKPSLSKDLKMLAMAAQSLMK